MHVYLTITAYGRINQKQEICRYFATDISRNDTYKKIDYVFSRQICTLTQVSVVLSS